MAKLLKTILRWLWPHNSKSDAVEKVLADKKLLKMILRYLSKNDLKSVQLVNPLWGEVTSEIISHRLPIIDYRGKSVSEIWNSSSLQMFVEVYTKKGVNLVRENIMIILKHDYPRETLDFFWKTIAPVVTTLEISYSGPTDKQHILTSIPFLKVAYPRLKNLRIFLYNINERYSVDTCRNMFANILLNSSVSSISVQMIGDDRNIEMSDILTNSIKSWKNNNELKQINFNGLQMRDHHFNTLSVIDNLKLTFVSLNIPTFEDFDESGHGLVKFLKSQENSLKSLIINDLTAVFDVEFPRLKHLVRLNINRYQQSPATKNEKEIRINYHEKLPALKCMSFQSICDKHPIHFLPEAEKAVVTSVKTISMEDENLSEFNAISILKSFGNLRMINISMSDGVLQAVCQTQPNLQELGLCELHNISASCLGEMLTGLKPDEITVLETVERNILDNLALESEYYNNETEAGDKKSSIQCLKRLERLIVPTAPSFVVFKILLQNMDSLRFVGTNNNYGVSLKDLPRGRPLTRKDFCFKFQPNRNKWLFAEPALIRTGKNSLRWTKQLIAIMIAIFFIYLFIFFIFCFLILKNPIVIQ